LHNLYNFLHIIVIITFILYNIMHKFGQNLYPIDVNLFEFKLYIILNS